MGVVELDSPALVMAKLQEIEREFATRQLSYEAAARNWYTAKREIERTKAQQLLASDEKTIAEKRARAEVAAYDVEGAASEAEYEAIKAVIRVLETRATVCQSILKAQGRA